MRVIIYFVVYYLFLFYYASNLHIGDLEVEYLSKNYPITYIENIFLYFFGNSDLSLRLPSLILSIISIFLYYQISKKYLKKQTDIYFSVVIFSLMPGFIIASLLFNKSIYIIFLVLLFIYAFLYYRFYSYILLLIYTIADYSFISLYMGLIFYSIYKKDTKFLIYSLILLMINANYFNYEIKGHPRGHFIDLLGIYFAIFSPFVFIYFIYALFKTFKKPTLLWFISSWGLLFSIILSFRQKIKIDDYAPFVIVAVVFMIGVFFNDYRVRLKIFRGMYRNIFTFLFGSLILFDILLFYSKYFDIKMLNQFKYSKEVFLYLKDNNIDNIYCNNDRFCNKLYFYGLHKGNKYYILFDKKDKKVSISHNHKKIYENYVSNLNKIDKK
jgi:hypothetical protein